MAKYEMHEVSPYDDLANPGDYLWEDRGDGTKFPVIVCPRCKRPGRCVNHTVIQVKPITIRASYLCGQRVKDGTCGWHGYVTDGWMEEC